MSRPEPITVSATYGPVGPIDDVDVRGMTSRLREGLAIAGWSLTGERPLPVVRIRAGDCVGFGEAPPLPTFTGLDAEATLNGLIDAAGRILGREPADALETLHDTPRLPSPVRCALDVALHDLIARARGVPIDRMLGRSRQDAVRISRAIGFGDREDLARRTRGYRARGVSAFKVKVGRGLAADRDAVETVRDSAGEACEIAIDANASLSVDDAIALVHAVRPYGVAYFEQPVARDDLAGLRSVREAGLPVMADESAFDAADVERLAQAHAVDLVAIKLIKCGGLAPAMKMVQAGIEQGVLLTVIDPLGSAISLNAGLAVALQIAPHPFAHGLSAGFDVDAPFAPHREVSDGRLVASQHPGLGMDVVWPYKEDIA